MEGNVVEKKLLCVHLLKTLVPISWPKQMLDLSRGPEFEILELCDPSRDTSRTFSAIEELLETLNDEDIERLFKDLSISEKGE